MRITRLIMTFFGTKNGCMRDPDKVRAFVAVPVCACLLRVRVSVALCGFWRCLHWALEAPVAAAAIDHPPLLFRSHGTPG